MLKRFFFIVVFVLTFSTVALAQNSNSSTTKVRPRTTTANTNTAAQKPAPSPPSAKRTNTPESEVLTAFDKLIAGLVHTNVAEVTGAYWNSPRLILFNYNGSVTKGWEQMRRNRESAYRDIKDVKLDVRDRHVEMLGRDGAVVTCLWTQSQTYKGAPDSASGRMTLVFKRVGNQWKAVHLHTSPDKPDASRVPASEQTQSPSPTPKPPPKL